MNRLILVTLISIALQVNLSAQIKLIPTPQKLELKNAKFEFTNPTKIISNDLDTFLIIELSNCIEKELGFQLKNKAKPKSSIEFIKAASAEELATVLRRNKLNPTFSTGAEGYVLDISSKKIKIIAQTDAGIFYGVQTLKQIITANKTGNTIPSMVIHDYPDFPVRAWQDDISRGPIPSMELLKEQIRTMASYKQNFFHLYIEHVFKLEKHPGIAPASGISKAQLHELSQYAKKYHVQLIGSYQSFGHMEETLSHPDYKHLAENDHIISPALKESYEFLEDVYSEIVPEFGSKFFNINCDETHGLGEGKSKEMVDSLGIDGVYIYHINKLNKILEKYDKNILMWGDIVSRYPNSIDQLPKDITVMAWGYHIADSFDYAIAPLANSGLDFWVAPGISCWSTIFPNIHTAEINIYNFIRDGYKHKASGVLNTSWDDDGLNFFHNNWHGLIWGAENSWKAPAYGNSKEQSDKKRTARFKMFNSAYDELFYGVKNGSLTDLIIEFSNLHQREVRNALRNSRFFESIFPIHLEYSSEEKRQENLKLLSQLTNLNNSIDSLTAQVTNNAITIEYLKFAIRQVQFTLNKNLLRIALFHYINTDSEISAIEIKKEISELLQEVEELRKEYRTLWLKENRPYWLENNLTKYDRLIEELTNLEGYCIITPDTKISEKGRKVTLRSLYGDLPVYYTINDDSVTHLHKKYTKPIFLKDNATIKARVISDVKKYPISESTLVYHKAIGKLHRLNAKHSTYHPSYDGGGKYGLLDGKQGDTDNLRSGKWQGFSGQNIDIEIDLDEKQPINSLSMGFFQNTGSWIIFPVKVEIYVKDNAEDEYILLDTITNTIMPEEKGALKQNLTTEFEDVRTRYIRVIAYTYGKLPEWHHAGSKYDSMLFSDEIILK